MIKKLLIALALLLPAVALAAPTTNYFFNIAPTITDTYNNGTASLRWLNFFTKYASTTQLTVSGQTSGCAQLDANGFLTSTGVNCSTSSSTFGTTSISAVLPLVWNTSTAQLSTLFGTTSTWGLGNNGIVATDATGIPYNTATSSLNIGGTALNVTGVVTLPHGGTGLNSVSGNSIIYTNNAGTAYVTTATSSLNLGVSGGGTGAVSLTGCLTGNGTGAITGSGTCVTTATATSTITGTQGQVVYMQGTNSPIGTSTLFITNASRVGIGTTTPISPLEVILDTATRDGIFATKYVNDVFGAGFIARKARGTPTSPSAVLSGDGLGIWGARGYGSTGFSPVTSASMRATAAENWTDTAQGTYLSFFNTAIGSSTSQEQMRLDAGGDLGLGTDANGAFVPAGVGNVLNISKTFTDGSTNQNSINVNVDSQVQPNGISQIRGMLMTVKDSAVTSGTGVLSGILLTLQASSTQNFATNNFTGFSETMQTLAGQTGTIVDTNGIRLNAPSFAGTKPATTYGVHIFDQGATGVNNSYGLYVEPQLASVNPVAAVFQGNVGIGTTTPLALLDVSTSSSDTSLTNFNGQRGIAISNTNTTNNNASALVFRTVDTNGLLATGAKMMGVYTSHAANAISADIAWLTRNVGVITEKMRLTAAGNLGIGTTTPMAKLSVHALNGQVNPFVFVVASSTQTATTTLFSVSNVGTASTTNLIVSSGGTGATKCAQFAADGTISAAAAACGSSSGLTSYDAWTHPSAGVSATTSNIIISASSTIGSGTQIGGLTINGGATTTLQSYFGGNVGIKMQPVYALDVAGSINIDKYSAYRQGTSTVLYASSTNNTLVIGGESTGLTGSGDIAIGKLAMSNATSSPFNIAIGTQALIGGGSGTALSETGKNTGIGYQSLMADSSGYQNTGVGSQTLLENTTGNNNVAVGSLALWHNTTGGQNFGLGTQALSGHTGSGDANIAIGTLTLYGAGSTYTSSNFNVAVGGAAGENIQTGANSNSLYGTLAGDNLTTGSFNIVIGAFTDLPSATATGQLNIANTIYGTGIYSSFSNSSSPQSGAKVGIGISNPSHQFEVGTDDAAKPTSNTWTITSDPRLKMNIKPFTDGLSVLMKIDPISYELNGHGGMPYGAKGISVDASKVKDVIPYTINTFNAKYNPTDATTTQFLDFNSSALTFVLINGVKDLNAKIDAINLGKVTRSAQDNPQDIVLGFLLLIVGYQQWQIRKLKK